LIRLAWADLRDKLGLPKAIKKTVAPAGGETVLDAISPVADEAIIAWPIAGEPAVEWPVEVGEGPLVVETVEVVEEMPDGYPVPEIESFGEPEIIPDVDAGDQGAPPLPPPPAVLPAPPISLDPSLAPVPSPVRIAPSRPMPVRSLVPPRPMPR
jgi:hypothetical protein